MVYDIFFGAQLFPLSLPGSESSYVVVATAKHKIPLLLANRDIWLEASPFFYRLHHFRIRLLTIGIFASAPYLELSEGVQQVFQVIQRVELTYQNLDLECAGDSNVSNYLGLLRRHCHALKSLRVELLHAWSLFAKTDFSACELKQLWPRLDSLQVCVEHYGDLDGMPLGEFIAPGELWRRGVCNGLLMDAAPQRRQTVSRKTVYCMVRHQKADEMA